MATTHAPDGDTHVSAHRGGQSSKQADDEFSLRQAELQMLLERVDEELVKCGLVPSTQHAHTSADTRRVEVGPDAGVRAVGEPVGGVMD